MALPSLSIGITLRNESIADLASRRIKEGLILAALVMAVLVVDLVYLLQCQKKVNLAQINPSLFQMYLTRSTRLL